MPRFKHVVELDYKPTFRTEKVAGMFDVPVTEKMRKEWDIDIPIEGKDWSVGLIVGASGAGKTTIAKRAFGDLAYFNGNKWECGSLLDDFSKSHDINTITGALSHVGLSSPPSWLLPYSALSNGQRFRADLARAILETEGLLVFDEFTSVVDRTVAKVGAFAAQKFIRKMNRQFVAVTCHYDVSEWLEPDWVYDVSASTFSWGRLRRPEIQLEVFRTTYKTWKIFADHHYLTGEINRSAACFVGCIDGRPVVFDAWLPFFGKLKGNQKGMRGHRTVCLPDFQGLGFGNKLFTQCAKMWSGLGYRVFSGTAHPAEINKRISSGEWRVTRSPSRTAVDSNRNVKRASNRLTMGFEFIGDPMQKEKAINLHGGI